MSLVWAMPCLTAYCRKDYDSHMKDVSRVAVIAVLGLLTTMSNGPAATSDERPYSESRLLLQQVQPNGPREPSGFRDVKAKPKQNNSDDRISIKESVELRRRAREAVASGDLKTAKQMLNTATRVTASAEKQAWLLVEAEYELARKRFAKAGLAAMRVAILNPDSESAGEALYWAARAYEGLQRPAKAIELYKECAARKGTDAAIRKLARTRLGELEKQVGE
jgi:tetratricopeptide (TPR) repeat protein